MTFNSHLGRCIVAVAFSCWPCFRSGLGASRFSAVIGDGVTESLSDRLRSDDLLTCQWKHGRQPVPGYGRSVSTGLSTLSPLDAVILLGSGEIGMNK